MRSNQLSYAALHSGCGGRIRTGNLRVMSPTSFLIAPPRDVFCRERESNPHEVIPSKDFKSLASANSAIPALFSTSRLLLCCASGAGKEIRTPDPCLGKAVLYR